jgi:hypothetical protein
LEEDGIPCGKARAFFLDAVGDFDGFQPLAVFVTRNPDADIGMALGRAAEPSGDEFAILGLDDRCGVAAWVGRFFEDEFGVDDACCSWAGCAGDIRGGAVLRLKRSEGSAEDYEPGGVPCVGEDAACHDAGPEKGLGREVCEVHRTLGGRVVAFIHLTGPTRGLIEGPFCRMLAID